MRFKLYSLFFLLTISCAAFASNNDYMFRSFTLSDKMVFGAVNAIAQDRVGFIWFGTDTGSYRFDGNDVVSMQDIIGGAGVIRAKQITVDAAGNLWIISYGHELYLCNPEAQQIKTIISKEDKRYLYDVKRYGEDGVIITSDQGVVHHNTATSKSDTLDRGNSYAVSTMHNGGFYVTKPLGQIKIFDKEFRSTTIQTKPASNIIWYIQAINDNEILLGYDKNGGLWLHDRVSKKSAPIITNRTINHIEEKIAGISYWIATDEGIYEYNHITKRLTNIQRIESYPFSLPDNSVKTIMRDAEGGMWVGTFFKGLCYHPNLPIDMSVFMSGHSQSGFKGNIVRGFGEDKYDNLWVSTEDGGLNRFNRKRQVVTNYSKKMAQTPLGSINIRATLTVDNQLWIATLDDGVEVMDIPSGRVAHTYNMQNTPCLKSNFVTALCRRNDDIYLGTQTSVLKYNIKTDSFVDISPDSIKFVTSLFTDSQGRVWCTAYNGIFIIDSNDSVVGYRNNPQDTSSTIVHLPYHVNEDRHSNIWIAGLGGLSMFCEDSVAPFVNYDMGVMSNLFRVEPDRFGTLWCLSSFALARFDPSSGFMQLYRSKDYLHRSLFYNSSFTDSKGDIFMGTLDGYVRIVPDSVLRHNGDNKIFLTKITYKHAETGLDTMIYVVPVNKTVFKHSQNTIKFDYAVPSYTLLNNTEYKYMLKGLDNRWTTSMEYAPITYQNLPSGDYTFIIKARSVSGFGAECVTRYSFRIRPIFWASIFAYILYGILLCAAVLGYIYYHQRRTNTQQQIIMRDFAAKKERELYDAKILFFTNLVHEIRTPLTLIKLPLEQLVTKLSADATVQESLDLIENNVNRLTDLCTQLLNFRSSENDILQLNFVRSDVSVLLLEEIARFDALVRQRGIALEVVLESQVIAAIDTEAFSKICNNLIGNAVKYCQSRITVRLTQTPDNLSLSIVNDGNIIPPSDREKVFTLFYRSKVNSHKIGSGIGLTLTKQLALMHNGDIELLFDHSGQNHFHLTLPLCQKIEFDPICIADDEGATLAAEVKIDPNRHTVLIVEDDKFLRKYETSLLKEQYNVLSAKNGAEALHVLRSFSISIVVSDIMMPVMNGMVLCKTIKSSVEFSNVPVILLTAKEDVESKLEGLTYGADDYITKPFSIKHLVVRINNIIENREKIYRSFNQQSLLTSLASTNSNGEDDAFLQDFCAIIEQEMDNSELNMDFVAAKLNVSQSSLYKKIKTATDISPNDYIRIMRLKRAADLLVNKHMRIKEVAYSVGFSSTTYFSTSFQKQYGVTPSEYIKKAT